MTAERAEAGRTAEKAVSAPAWPADRVERRPVASLVPYARNARTHSPRQVEQLADSIREFGWTVPIVVDEQSNIIAGHGRVLAAQRLGLAEVPVVVARGWSEVQRRAYLLADNKLPLGADWDPRPAADRAGRPARPRRRPGPHGLRRTRNRAAARAE